MQDFFSREQGGRAPAPASLPRATATDHARVRRAEAVMLSRSADALSIATVAEELGLSLRSLQTAFRNVHGEGAKARLTRIRLERARRRLIEAAPYGRVTDIALECGFTHLGRFAAAYCSTFGERPCETLAVHRRRSFRR
jgi:transcriptional regulator GlxA family with amidase domain